MPSLVLRPRQVTSAATLGLLPALNSIVRWAFTSTSTTTSSSRTPAITAPRSARYQPRHDEQLVLFTRSRALARRHQDDPGPATSAQLFSIRMPSLWTTTITSFLRTLPSTCFQRAPTRFPRRRSARLWARPRARPPGTSITVAGTPNIAGFGGDGASATAGIPHPALLNFPTGLALSRTGRADQPRPRTC